jgi:hypothetical protein
MARSLKGVFQQEGRTERHFDPTLGAGGAIKTTAKFDGGSTMSITGTIKDGANRVVLDGYCKFDAKLTSNPDPYQSHHRAKGP